MRCRHCRDTFIVNDKYRALCPLCQIAQDVTDSVMGQGTYAHVNGLAPDLTIEEVPDGTN